MRDPRFESLSGGQYNDERFKKQYAFLYDEKLPQEGADLKAQMAKVRREAVPAGRWSVLVVLPCLGSRARAPAHQLSSPCCPHPLTPLQTKSLARKEQLKAELTQVEQQLRNEEQRRRKASFQEGVKVRAAGGRERGEPLHLGPALAPACPPSARPPAPHLPAPAPGRPRSARAWRRGSGPTT